LCRCQWFLVTVVKLTNKQTNQQTKQTNQQNKQRKKSNGKNSDKKVCMMMFGSSENIENKNKKEKMKISKE